MSGQKYSTISGVIVLFNVIMDHLDRYIDGEYETYTTPPAIIIDAAKAAYAVMRKYYNKTNELHCVVTILDPRFKVQYFRDNVFTEEMITSYVKR